MLGKLEVAQVIKIRKGGWTSTILVLWFWVQSFMPGSRPNETNNLATWLQGTRTWNLASFSHSCFLCYHYSLHFSPLSDTTSLCKLPAIVRGVSWSAWKETEMGWAPGTKGSEPKNKTTQLFPFWGALSKILV